MKDILQQKIEKQAELIETQAAYISNLKDQVDLYKRIIEIKEETIKRFMEQWKKLPINKP
jgi:hypothetical protein